MRVISHLIGAEQQPGTIDRTSSTCFALIPDTVPGCSLLISSLPIPLAATQLQSAFRESLVNISYTWSHGLTTDPADRSTGGSALPRSGRFSHNMAHHCRPRHVLTETCLDCRGCAQAGVYGHILGGWQFSASNLPDRASLQRRLGQRWLRSGNGVTCNDPTVQAACLGIATGLRPNQIGDPTPCSHTSQFGSTPPPWRSVRTQTTETTGAPGAIRGRFWPPPSLFKT